ncbi:MAG TPA: endonuclease III [Candidatus Paceibacterota bacterium]|nr:endonuclease III [Candidatus Paceibacterota bacterium]
MTPATLKERKERMRKLDQALKKLFPNVGTELVYKIPWQFMVAVQLSAQCTDKRVNIVTKELFKKYKTVDDYAKANVGEFEKAINSVTYYHNKARNIIAAAKFVKKEFKGKLPRTMEEMIKIPGVGRKTANVVLADLYGITPGITVDTHVIRFVSRFGLSDHRDAVRIERDLMQIVPKKEWRTFTHRIIHYGRYLAPARAYDTTKDPLMKIYPPAGKQFRV